MLPDHSSSLSSPTSSPSTHLEAPYSIRGGLEIAEGRADPFGQLSVFIECCRIIRLRCRAPPRVRPHTWKLHIVFAAVSGCQGPPLIHVFRCQLRFYQHSTLLRSVTRTKIRIRSR